MGERSVRNAEVRGSIPLISTILKSLLFKQWAFILLKYLPSETFVF